MTIEQEVTVAWLRMMHYRPRDPRPLAGGNVQTFITAKLSGRVIPLTIAPTGEYALSGVVNQQGYNRSAA